MDVILYDSEDGAVQLEVQLERETVWLNQRQMSELFDKDTDTIGLHIRNIYKEGELSRKGTTEKSSVVQSEGGRQVRRKVSFYNLDVIISVGYRVKSKRGTQFRQWATRVLREHLVRGFTLNEKRLREQDQKLIDLRRTVSLLEQTLDHPAIGLDEAKGLLRVITDYAYALTTLDRFDHGTLAIERTTRPAAFVMHYDAAMEIVKQMKTEFAGLFGLEKDQGFKSALGAIYQTFTVKSFIPALRKKPPTFFTSLLRTMPLATETSASAPLCSSLLWPVTRLFTGLMAQSE